MYIPKEKIRTFTSCSGLSVYEWLDELETWIT